MTRSPGRASPHRLRRVAQPLVLRSPRSGRLTTFHVLPVLLSPCQPLKESAETLPVGLSAASLALACVGKPSLEVYALRDAYGRLSV